MLAYCNVKTNLIGVATMVKAKAEAETKAKLKR